MGRRSKKDDPEARRPTCKKPVRLPWIEAVFSGGIVFRMVSRVFLKSPEDDVQKNIEDEKRHPRTCSIRFGDFL
jgi:hypothetical protein